MQLEHKTATFDVDDDLQNKVQELAKEGWVVAEGTKPQITYALVRMVQEPSSAGFGKMSIDDSKVIVIKAGEPL